MFDYAPISNIYFVDIVSQEIVTLIEFIIMYLKGRGGWNTLDIRVKN